MNCDTDDEELKLAKEYKCLLSNIRPSIDQLDNSRDAQLCLLWLTKLEQCSKWERKYRNQILSELCKQVNDKLLKEPFSSPPPCGPLQNIILGFFRVSDWNYLNLNELSEITTELTSNSPDSESSIRTPSKQYSVQPSWKEEYLCSKKNFRGKGSAKPELQEEPDHSECFAIQKAYHERTQNDEQVIERCQDIIKSLFAQQLRTDISPNRLKKIQLTYESKITKLIHSLKMYQEENDMLRRKLDCNGYDLDKVEKLKLENKNLKEQLANITAAKNSLEVKFKESDEQKLITFTDLMSKLNESNKKFKESEKHLKSLEKKLKENYHNYETEHQTEKIEMEKTYAANLNAMKSLLEQKESEILDLREQITNQCSHFEEEVTKLKHELAENTSFERDKKKIKVLKNKTRKLEKIKEHMTVLFQSQLEQIIAKKDYYIKTLEMQLEMYNSKAESTNINSDVHNALVQKVSTLESQYRKLLEDAEKQSLMRRQLDLQKIHNLEKQLLLCGGEVEDGESVTCCRKTKSLMSFTTNEDAKPDNLPS